jgi:hypothetical protein
MTHYVEPTGASRPGARGKSAATAAALPWAMRFITSNSKVFGKSISEIEITFPADLPDPG